jgi:hypothetical protein
MDKDDLARLALLASVMSTASDGIISVDEEQLIISFNDGAQGGPEVTVAQHKGYGTRTFLKITNWRGSVIKRG